MLKLRSFPDKSSPTPNPYGYKILSPMIMGEEGLEPSIPCGNKILSLASIPISPFALDVAGTAVTNFNIYCAFFKRVN